MKRQELLDLVVETEQKHLKEQGEVIPKMFALDDDGKFALVVLTGLPSTNQEKQMAFKAIGQNLRREMDKLGKKLEELLFVSDTIMGFFDPKAEYTGKKKKIVEKIKSGTIAPSEIPEKFIDLRKEALIIITNNSQGKQGMLKMEYERKGKEFNFSKLDDMGTEFSDTLVTSAWYGYVYPDSTKDKAIAEMFGTVQKN